MDASPWRRAAQAMFVVSVVAYFFGCVWLSVALAAANKARLHAEHAKMAGLLFVFGAFAGACATGIFFGKTIERAPPPEGLYWWVGFLSRLYGNVEPY